MKRPSLQFYPADWRNNAKLRRCSWEAKGVWIELIGLLHDSDNYGVLLWPLKEIAQALGAPIKTLKELADKGVLYGVEKGACEPMIYTPKSGRVEGPSVVLLAIQDGPIWYSPRMVRDEYVRAHRGEKTRFGGSSDAPNPKQTPSPKPPIGEGNGAAPNGPPNPPQGDGAASSSSSTSSIPNGIYGDGRQKFEMVEGWLPDELNLKTHMRMMGVTMDDIDEKLIESFVGYWMTQPGADTHASWCRRLVLRAQALKVHNAKSSTATDWAENGVLV